MIVAINYADEKFRNAQKYNTKTAYRKGKVDKVIEYSPNDIDDEFIENNKSIFKHKRGSGLWLWKPYFIIKALREINNGDYLFYCDSGSYYINRIELLVKCMEKSNQEIMVFELPLISKQWTKTETFEFMNCNTAEIKNSNQILAGYILIKKTSDTVKFFDQFLLACCNEENISYNKFNKEIKNDIDFIEHREDQSILTILCRKNNIIPFRDVSQYGDRPWEYVSSGRLIKYNKYDNSNYPRIIMSQRKTNLYKFKLKEFFKDILLKFNIIIYREI